MILWWSSSQFFVSLVLHRKFSDIVIRHSVDHFPSTALSSLCPTSARPRHPIFSSRGLHGFGTLSSGPKAGLSAYLCLQNNWHFSISPQSTKLIEDKTAVPNPNLVSHTWHGECSADICWAHAWMHDQTSLTSGSYPGLWVWIRPFQGSTFPQEDYTSRESARERTLQRRAI